MASYYDPYWFPECLICGKGNLGAVVCLNHGCHEKHGLVLIDDVRGNEHEKDGHYWNKCEFCVVLMLADPWSIGSFAICSDCWNSYVRLEQYPPVSPLEIGRRP